MSSVHRIRHALDEASRAATSLQLHLAWKQLECAVNWPGEVRYREDQPRAPGGARDPTGVGIGGRWIDDPRAPAASVQVALAGRLIDSRSGPAGDRMIRICTYIDYLGRMYSREIDALELCPVYYVAPAHYGPL